MTNNMLALLDLDLGDILAHLVTFLILIVALGFLVYKPMLKLIHTRQDNCKKQIEANEAAKKEAEAMKEEYTNLLKNAEVEVIAKKKKADDELLLEREAEIAKTKAQVSRMLEQASDEIEAEKKKAVDDMKGEIVEVACAIASGILSKKLTTAQDKKIVDQCLDEWSRDNG